MIDFHDKFLTDLVKSPEKTLERLVDGHGPIKIDVHCMCNGGLFVIDAMNSNKKSSVIRPLSNQFSCDACRELTSYVSHREDVSGKRFKLNVGSIKDKHVSINRFPNIRLNYDIEPTISIDLQVNDSILRKKTRHFNVDDFTSRFVNMTALNALQADQGFVNFNQTLKTYICGKDGYIFAEDPQHGSLDIYVDHPTIFTPTNCKSIVFQILTATDRLYSRRFSMTNPTIGSLSLSKNNQISTLKYKDKKQNTKLSLKFNHSDYNIDIDSVRVYHDYLSGIGYQIPTNGKTFQLERDWNLLNNAMKRGEIAESSTICSYMLLSGLYSIPAFASIASNDELLSNVWKNMWFEERKMPNLIDTTQKALDFISDIPLKSRMMKDVINLW